MRFKTMFIADVLMLFIIAITLGEVATAAESKITLKVAQVATFNPDYVNPFGVNWIAKRIEELAAGKVEAKTYHATLGGETEMTEDIKLGNLDILLTSTSTLSQFVKEIGILNLPCIFEGNDIEERFDKAFKVIDGPFGAWLGEKSLEKGIRIVQWWRNGGLSIFSNVPIRKLEDLKGRKIRTMASPEHLELFKAYGANAITISWRELYTATQTGVVDGFFTIMAAVWTEHMQEVIKYITELDQIIILNPVMVSEKKWKTYPEDVKKAIMQAAAESKVVLRNQDKIFISKFRKNFVDYGTKIFTLTPAELKPFGDIAKKEIWPKFIRTDEEKKQFQMLRNAQE